VSLKVSSHVLHEVVVDVACLMARFHLRYEYPESEIVEIRDDSAKNGTKLL
jgi:hypothetical protein